MSEALTMTEEQLEVAPMDEYRAHIQQVADEADGEAIALNRTPAHAAVVFSIIFAKAQSIVQVLTSDLTHPVWSDPEVIASAIDFLRRNVQAKLRIVVEHDGLAGGRPALLTAFVEGGVDAQVKLFVLPEGGHEPFHFIVADGQHYRFQHDRSRFEATIQFGAEDLGGKLQVIFDAVRARCGQEVALT